MFSINKVLNLKEKFSYLIGKPIARNSNITIDEIIIIDATGQEVIDDLIDEEDLKDLRHAGNGYYLLLSSGESDTITRPFLEYCKENNLKVEINDFNTL